MAHDPEIFFVIYLTYVNMSVVNKEIFYLVPPIHGSGNFKKCFYEL